VFTVRYEYYLPILNRLWRHIDCEMLRIQHCLDYRLTDGGEAVSRKRRQSFTQKYLLVFVFARSRVNSTAMVKQEGLDKLPISNDFIMN
jgi:hypothetical protein